MDFDGDLKKHLSSGVIHLNIDHKVIQSRQEQFKNPLCAGALRYMRINAKRPKDRRILKIVESLTLVDCENILPCQEFIDHHSKYKKK